MITRTFFTLLLSLAFFATAQADGNYTLEKVDGKYVCRGTVSIKKNDRATFGSAVLWTLDQTLDQTAKNAVKTVNANDLTVSIRPDVKVNDESVQSYSFNLTLKVENGRLHYLISNVKCTPNGFFGSITAVNLDKINTEKKPKQKVLIDKFAALCNEYVPLMISGIKDRNVVISHWDAILQGQVVKGMNGDECILSVGKADTITENPQRTQWQYESGMIIVFENGLVSAVVK